MTLYYRSPDAVVTSEAIEVWHPYQQFRINGLADVHAVRYPLDPAVVKSAQAGAAAVLAVVVSWRIITTWPNGRLLALALVAAPVLISLALLRMRPRQYELRATYGSYRVVLLTSPDLRVVEQVGRALRRAMELPENSWERFG